APVDALVLRKNVLANDVVLALLELFLDELLVLEDFFGAELFGERLDHRRLRGLVTAVALGLVLDERALDDLRVDERRDARLDRLVALLRLEATLRLAAGGADLLDDLDDRLRGLVREEERV